MLKKILIGLVVVIAIFVGVVATRPSEFHVTRSATMAATAAVVYAQVTDLHAWGGWDPWAKLDPNAKTTFDGPQAGVGAAMAWDGNNDVGAGKMTILESKPGALVRLKLEFLKPMEGTSEAVFTFKPEGDKTVVTWSMSGKNNFIGKACSLFMDCDKLIGGNFEQGLASLKAIVETPAAK